jgi:hypothetical protein
LGTSIYFLQYLTGINFKNIELNNLPRQTIDKILTSEPDDFIKNKDFKRGSIKIINSLTIRFAKSL